VGAFPSAFNRLTCTSPNPASSLLTADTCVDTQVRDVNIVNHSQEVRALVAQRPQVTAAVAAAVSQLDHDTAAMCYQVCQISPLPI
jgi:hypothetical protein